MGNTVGQSRQGHTGCHGNTVRLCIVVTKGNTLVTMVTQRNTAATTKQVAVEVTGEDTLVTVVTQGDTTEQLQETLC